MHLFIYLPYMYTLIPIFTHEYIWALFLVGQKPGKISQPLAISGQLLFLIAWDRQNHRKVNINLFFTSIELLISQNPAFM